MLKLKNHLYQSLEKSNTDLENPNDEELIEIGGGYRAPLGEIYKTISVIESLEDGHFDLTFEEIEDIEESIISIQERLENLIPQICGSKIDEENPIVKLHRSIAKIYPIEW